MTRPAPHLDDATLRVAPRHSLKGRLLRVLLGSLTLLLAAGFAGIYLLQRELLTNEFDRESFRRIGEVMRDVARSGDEPVVLPSPLVRVMWIGGDATQRSWSVPRDAQVSLADLGLGALEDVDEDSPPIMRNAVLDDGMRVRVFVRHFRRFGRRRGDGPEPPPMESAGPAGDRRDAADPGDSQDEPRRPRGEGTQRRLPPHGMLVALADREQLDAALRRWMSILVIACASGEVLVAAVVLMAVGRALASLKPLAEEISSIDSQKLSARVSTESLPAELRPVVAQVNSLLQRLEAAFHREQDFTAEAAHELRTPLAGMRTQLEVLLRRPRDGQEYRRAATGLLDLVESLGRMVDSMMDLARLDSGQAAPSSEPVDLVELVRSLWRDSEAVARDRGCVFTLESPETLALRSDRALLERIVGNLLANAAEYGDAGGTIALILARAEGRVVLELSNPATSLVEADAAHLFKRLWRGDKARSAAADHCGLGLSIVKRSVELLGGEIDARLADGRLSFAVTLPGE